MKCERYNEKEKVGYFYCTLCADIVRREKNSLAQKLRRIEKKEFHLCQECHKVETSTKYCKPCSGEVKKRIDREASAKRYVPKREDNPVDPKWLVRGNISNASRGCYITNDA